MAGMIGSQMKKNARNSLRAVTPLPARKLLRQVLRKRTPGRPQAAGAPSQPPARNRGYWFKSKREDIREMCLDAFSSPIWNYVDRGKFEEYTAQPGGPPMQESKYLGGLYVALTLFSYETFNTPKSV